MSEFLDKVAEILEVDAVAESDVFRDVGDFDSMKGFALIVMIMRDYGRQLTVPEFMNCQTVGDLAVAAEVK